MGILGVVCWEWFFGFISLVVYFGRFSFFVSCGLYDNVESWVIKVGL